MLSKDHDKTRNSNVTFVTHKRFAILFLLPSCHYYCANFVWIILECGNDRVFFSQHIPKQQRKIP